VSERLSRCRSCAGPIWWRLTAAGKRQPMDYDLVAGQPTETPHHATCPQGREWRGQTRESQDAAKQTLPW